MKKLGLFLLLISLVGPMALAQNTTAVSATVTDSDGQTWNSATCTATLINPGGGTPHFIAGGIVPNPVNCGPLSGAGVLSAAIPDNNKIDVQNTQWSFSICAVASVPCNVLPPITITGTSQSLSTFINANITAPRFVASTINANNTVNDWGYADIEVATTPSLTPGEVYYNVNSKVIRINQYDSSTNTTSWQSVGTGGGTGNPSTPANSVQYNNGGSFGGMLLTFAASNLATLQQDVTTCGSNPCEISLMANASLTSDYTIPANVVLTFPGGQLLPNGHTLTISSLSIAWPAVQIFGTGTVAFSDTHPFCRPEWFGSTFFSACISISPNGLELYLLDSTYRSGYDKNSPTDYSNVTKMTTPNVHIHGTQRGVYNSTSSPTAMVKGTICQGGMYVGRQTAGGGQADNFFVENVSFDSGSAVLAAFYSGYTAEDSLVVSGAVIGDATHYTNLQGAVILNDNCLGANSTTPDHCFLMEAVDGARISGTQSFGHQHCEAIKGTSIEVDGFDNKGCGTSGLIIKSNSYSPSNDINVSNGTISSGFASGDTAGIDIQGGDPASGLGANLTRVNITNVAIDNTIYGVQVEADATCGGGTVQCNVSAINIQGLHYNAEALSSKPCISSIGTASAFSLMNLAQYTCVNSTGVTATFAYSSITGGSATGTQIDVNQTGAGGLVILQHASGSATYANLSICNGTIGNSCISINALPSTFSATGLQKPNQAFMNANSSNVNGWQFDTSAAGASFGVGVNHSQQFTCNGSNCTYTVPVVSSSVAQVFNTAGTAQTSSHMVIISGSLVGGSGAITFSGSAVFSGASSYKCSFNDTTGTNVIQVASQLAGSMSITGVGTDGYQGICIGN